MTYEIYMASIKSLEIASDELSNRLRSYPKGPMGLTPDSVKRTKDYQETKRAFNVTMQGIRKLNSMAPKGFFLKWRDERRAQRVG